MLPAGARLGFARDSRTTSVPHGGSGGDERQTSLCFSPAKVCRHACRPRPSTPGNEGCGGGRVGKRGEGPGHWQHRYPWRAAQPPPPSRAGVLPPPPTPAPPAQSTRLHRARQGGGYLPPLPRPRGPQSVPVAGGRAGGPAAARPPASSYKALRALPPPSPARRGQSVGGGTCREALPTSVFSLPTPPAWRGPPPRLLQQRPRNWLVAAAGGGWGAGEGVEMAATG